MYEVFDFQGNEGYSWIELPFTYIITPSSRFKSSLAIERFLPEISVVHFVCSVKPWLYTPAQDFRFLDLCRRISNEAHLDAERIKLLSRNPNDNFNLMRKEGEAFVDITSITSAFRALNVGNTAKVFSWEHWEPVQVSRVYDLDTS